MSRYDVRQDSLLLKLPRADEGLPCAGNVIIHRRLGKGGMGTVYLGFDRNLAAEVAVKVLPFGFAEESSAVERFFREARSTFKLDHPNIVRVLTVDREGDTYYLVMEFVDGESADARVKREGPLPERDALEIAVGAGEALAAAHAKGILHRDVKPANILIRFEDGRVKLADLGLAKALGGEGGETTGLTATGAMLGTPAYMSPEQAEDASRADERTDIYSLGATLYAVLIGKAPFEETQLLKLLMKVTKAEPKDLRSLRWEVSEETAGAVKKLMAKAPGERPQTINEVVRLLRGCLDAAPTEDARGLARLEMAGRRNVKIAVEEVTPAPVAPRTLDDVTPSQVGAAIPSPRRGEGNGEVVPPRPALPRRGGGIQPVALRMSGGKKLAIALGILAALAAAGAYLSQKLAADPREDRAAWRDRFRTGVIERSFGTTPALREKGRRDALQAVVDADRAGHTLDDKALLSIFKRATLLSPPGSKATWAKYCMPGPGIVKVPEVGRRREYMARDPREALFGFLDRKYWGDLWVWHEHVEPLSRFLRDAVTDEQKFETFKAWIKDPTRAPWNPDVRIGILLGR